MHVLASCTCTCPVNVVSRSRIKKKVPRSRDGRNSILRQRPGILRVIQGYLGSVHEQVGFSELPFPGGIGERCRLQDLAGGR